MAWNEASHLGRCATRRMCRRWMGCELAWRCVLSAITKKKERAGELGASRTEPTERGLEGRESLQTVFAMWGMAQPPNNPVKLVRPPATSRAQWLSRWPRIWGPFLRSSVTISHEGFPIT